MRFLFKPLRALVAATVRGRREGVLIVQPLPGIGDMVWHLPHIHSIAAAEHSAVTVLTKRRSLADKLFIADPAVREVLWLERNPGRHDALSGLLRLARELRDKRFAKAWLLHGSSRYAWALLLAGIPVTIGFGRGTQRWLLSEPAFLPRHATHGHPIRLADALLAAYHVRQTESAPSMKVNAQAVTRMDAEYRQCARPWFVLGIGCSEDARQWGATRFIALADRLLSRYAGTVYLLGGPAEREMAQAVRSALTAYGERVVSVTDRGLDESAALLSLCTLCIANETGVFNVAAAAGARTVGLIVTDWQPPWRDGVHILRPSPPHAGVEGITVDAVIAAVESVLGSG